ncbi:MAG TPA: glutathione peroxidase [Bacteroidia bacterium]|jgi:glutathione peroxidase|nr:glutathione peroxidase [Bacteroidia bacterium]
MKTLLITTLLALSAMFVTDTKSIHQFKVKTLEGKEFDFASLSGKKIMVVNTASECGFTPQYKDLEALYQKYKDKNFTIIGFPCNDFGGQEPGNAEEIRGFCTKNYGVTFPLMEKISVTTCPVYLWLKSKEMNGVEESKVTWNFNKYLLDEKGHLVKHLGSKVTPMDEQITNWIEGK